MKSILIFFIFMFCSLSVCSQNIVNTIGNSGLFTIKDASSNYLTLSQSTGQVSILKTLRMENTLNSTIGVLFKGADRFIHNFQPAGTNGFNTFIGISSGNFTMSGSTNQASYNTGLGSNTLSSVTTGYKNTAIGSFALFSNTAGYHNTANGDGALFSNVTGLNNTAIGEQSLYSNTTGSQNTGLGSFSIYSSLTPSNLTAVGYRTLFSNTAGAHNTAIGTSSMFANTTGNYNTAIGSLSLGDNISGDYNISIGYISLSSNASGSSNVSIGSSSLQSNTTGSGNTSIGASSLLFNIIGDYNTAIGLQSLYSSTGNLNSALGFNAGSNITTGSNNTCLGYNSQPSNGSVTNQITLGNNQITSLRCNVQTITSLSDARDKKNINDLSLGLDFITKLKPRQFNWDKREWYEDDVSDGSKMQEAPTAGFIAQELNEVQTSENAEWLNLVLKDNPEKWEATPGNLLPVMVKAIQELKSENDELKNKLAMFEEMQNMIVLEIEKLRPMETVHSTDLSESSK